MKGELFQLTWNYGIGLRHFTVVDIIQQFLSLHCQHNSSSKCLKVHTYVFEAVYICCAHIDY